MKKKIGIVTFFKNNNYGAVLQAYALFKFLKKKKFQVELIDINNDLVNLDSSVIRFRSPNILHSIIDIINFKSRNTLIIKFRKFIKDNLKISKNLNNNNIENYCKKFDLLIAGGDQIWNPSLLKSNDLDKSLFMNFYHKNKISYAPSIGDHLFTKNQLNKLQNILSNYKKISIREKFLQKSLIKKKITEVADPVFLHDYNFYKKISNKLKKKLNEKYSLFYFNKSNNYFNKIIKYEKVLSKIYLINQNINSYTFKALFYKNCKNISDAGIEEFLFYFIYSTKIYTNTFHGICFAILFKKDFYFVGRNPDRRVLNILKKLNLLDRIIIKPATYSKINYDNVYINLEKIKKTSLDFINDALLQN